LLLLVFAGGCLIVALITPTKQAKKEEEPKKPRIILPTDKRIYTVTVDSELKDDEWEMILGAGWTLVTCNPEQRKEYAGCYPGAPSYNKTYWHYVFQKGY
jgi:hypothetical protein